MRPLNPTLAQLVEARARQYQHIEDSWKDIWDDRTFEIINDRAIQDYLKYVDIYNAIKHSEAFKGYHEWVEQTRTMRGPRDE
jgi:hypothetical protein